jgi:hypothetical protein
MDVAGTKFQVVDEWQELSAASPTLQGDRFICGHQRAMCSLMTRVEDIEGAICRLTGRVSRVVETFDAEHCGERIKRDAGASQPDGWRTKQSAARAAPLCEP